MKKTLLLLITTILLGTISSCSSQKELGSGIPGWALNPDDYYDSQEYLMAVGSGSTLDEASKDAFAGLSQIFKMDVEGTEEVSMEMSETYSNSEVFTESTSILLNNIKIGTHQELINTNILEAQVASDGMYYALAGMKRLETARIYNQEISSNVLRLEELEAQADEEVNVLQKLIVLKQTRMLAMANHNLTKQHNVIMRGASDTELSTQRLSRIEDKFRETQKRATFAITSDNATETIISAVAEVLQNEGFSRTPAAENAVLDVNVNYLTQKADLQRDDSEFVRWELVIGVKDLQANQDFKTYITEGRDGALSFSDALNRADYTARNKISNDFKRFINQQLLSYK